VDARYGLVASALRADVQKRGITLDKLFEEVGNGEDRISEEAFYRHLQTLDCLSLKAEHCRLLFRHIEQGGMGKRKFLSFLQQYFAVVKPIAVTNEFEVSKAKTIRKANIDEVLEVTEGPCTDPKVGLTRIKGKSLSDSIEGWVSVRGNQGTPFLQEVEKPFYSCTEEIELMSEFKGENVSYIRTLKADEVLELLEGPRKEVFEPALRLRGKAPDGEIGWLTVRDKKGTVFAEVDDKLYACSTSVAMTNNLDIKECKVVRKLAVGELFTVVEGPVEEKEANITRVKGRCLKDDQEGWVTVKGNAGTTYASPSTTHYKVIREVRLQKTFASETAEAVRELQKDEALRDGTVGWITLKGENVKPWSPYYKCVVSMQLYDSPSSDGAAVVREIAIGETLEILEGPVDDNKELRMKARAEKDNAIGWATIRGSDGKQFLQS